MYYVVTEGRARVLDRMNLIDRSTYGIDWMVLDATNSRDAVRQWNVFKAGTHARQAELELEAAKYRSRVPDYLPAWQAESEIVSLEIDETLDTVKTKRQELDQLRGRLEVAKDSLVGASARRNRTTSRRRKPSAARKKSTARKRASGQRRRAA
jgi:hypothetical protein